MISRLLIYSVSSHKCIFRGGYFLASVMEVEDHDATKIIGLRAL